MGRKGNYKEVMIVSLNENRVKTKLVLMVGAPGSGKSTYIENYPFAYPFAYVCSRDKIRFSKLKDGEEYFSHEKEVVKDYLNLIREKVKDCNFVIADATHMTRKSRYHVLKIGQENNCIVEAWVMDTPLNDCIKNNEKREGIRKVPIHAIKKLFYSFEDPTISEGFDIIRRVGGN